VIALLTGCLPLEYIGRWRTVGALALYPRPGKPPGEHAFEEEGG